MAFDLAIEMERLGAAALGETSYIGPISTPGNELSVGAHLTEAEKNADVDMFHAHVERLAFAKKGVYRLAGLFLRRQRDYNEAMIRAVSDLNHQMSAFRGRVLMENNRTAATLTNVSLSVEDLTEQLDRVLILVRREAEELARLEADRAIGAAGRYTDERMSSGVTEIVENGLTRSAGQLEAALAETHKALAEVNSRNQAMRTRVSALMADLRGLRRDVKIGQVEPTDAGAPTTAHIAEAVAAADTHELDSFYERFEDRMRGGNATVAERLRPYLADVMAVADLAGDIIDFGCGRGEWLSLLAAENIDAFGIDTNADAIAQCIEAGLSARLGDGIAYLESVEPGSVKMLTAFHVIEHLPVDIQFAFVRAALRALAPGGLLILETPNPTNLTVGAASFYLDPTHLRPVNPSYLAFLCEDSGFVGVQTRFLHPKPDYAEAVDHAAPTVSDELMWALRGPMDYAIVATVPVESGSTPS